MVYERLTICPSWARLRVRNCPGRKLKGMGPPAGSTRRKVLMAGVSVKMRAMRSDPLQEPCDPTRGTSTGAMGAGPAGASAAAGGRGGASADVEGIGTEEAMGLDASAGGTTSVGGLVSRWRR